MYGASKIACEHMCSAYYHSYGISSVAIRLLNTYGPHCQPERFPSIIQQKFESDAIPHFILTSKSTKRWLDIQVMAKRIIFIIQNITIGFDIFNFVGNEDLNLIEFIRKISNDRPFTYEYKIDALSGYNPDYNADGTKFMDFYNKIINKIPNDY
jgi:nucleoside-diphosphate-sugar epimerase